MAENPLEAFFLGLEADMGVPADQVKLVFCFFLAVPLGYFQLYFVRGALVRHLYSIFWGVAFALIQYSAADLVGVVLSTIAVYAMLLVLPRNQVALPVFLFAMGVLSYMHINRMMSDMLGWKMDATGTQMLLTCKLTSLAYAYQDGERIKKSPERVPTESKELVVDRLPNLIEYYSYLCFYPSVLIGPSFEYTDYLRFVHMKGEFATIPNPFVASTKALAMAVGFSVLVVIYGKDYSHDVLVTEEFAASSFLQKLAVMNFAAIIMKVRYSSAWKFNEASMISTGLGYSPNKANPWDRAVCINWSKAELAWTAKEMVDNWNISVAVWIRRCIYNRILLSGKDPKPTPVRSSMAQHLSYLSSAFWHGFYPAYYAMFFLFSFHSEISKMVYKSNWDFLPFKSVFKWLAWILMWQIGNSLGLLFMLLTLSRGLKFYSEMYYLTPILLGIGWAFFKVTGLHRRPNKPKSN